MTDPRDTSALTSATAQAGNDMPSGGTNYETSANGQPATVNVSPESAVSGQCTNTLSETVNVKNGTSTTTDTLTCKVELSQSGFNAVISEINTAVSEFASTVANAIGVVANAIDDAASAVGGWISTLIHTLADGPQAGNHDASLGVMSGYTSHAPTTAMSSQQGWVNHEIGNSAMISFTSGHL